MPTPIFKEIFPRDRMNLPEQMKKKEFNKLVLEKVQQILEGHQQTAWVSIKKSRKQLENSLFQAKNVK